MWNVTKDVCETEEAGTRETNEKSCRKGYEEEGKVESGGAIGAVRVSEQGFQFKKKRETSMGREL